MAHYDDYDFEYYEHNDRPRKHGQCNLEDFQLIPGPPGRRGPEGPRGPRGPRGHRGRDGRPAPFMFGLCAYGYAYNSGAGASLNNSTGLYDEQPIPFDILGVNKNIGIVADVFYIQRSGDYEINYQLDGIVTQTGIVGLVIYVNGFRVPQSVVSKHFVAGQKNIVSGNYSLKLFPNNTVSISVILENGAIFNVESGTYLSVKKLDSCPVRMHRAGVREADAAAEPASDTPQAAEE